MAVNTHPRESADRRTDKPASLTNQTTLLSGEFHVTNKPGHMIATILGSCVSACIHDPVAKAGGMNHFLLPEGPASVNQAHSDAARYGSYAMEELINGIIKLGGMKNRMEVKIFGGANVIENSSQIGSRNVAFVREFLRYENLKLTGEDLGGDYPRRVRFYPDTGKVMMLRLRRKEDFAVANKEKEMMKTLTKKPVEGSIELFGED